MRDVTVTDARSELAQTIECARLSGEPIGITQRGRRVAVLLGVEAYQALLGAFEDAVDLDESDKALAEGDFIPWEDVKAELGL